MNFVAAENPLCYVKNMNKISPPTTIAAIALPVAFILCITAIIIFHNTLIKQDRYINFDHDINELRIDLYRLIQSDPANREEYANDLDKFTNGIKEIILSATRDADLNDSIKQTDMQKNTASMLELIETVSELKSDRRVHDLQKKLDDSITEALLVASKNLNQYKRVTTKTIYGVLILICILLIIYYYLSYTPLKRELLKALNDKEKAFQTIREMTHRDPMTNLPGRAKFYEDIFRELAAYERYGTELSIIKLDICDFKDINIRYGQQKGDRILNELSRLLRRHLRRIDRLYRSGGDKFIILAPHTSGENAYTLASKLSEIISENVFSGEIKIAANFGIAHCNKDDNSESLIHRVSLELKNSKKNGPGFISYSDENGVSDS